MKRLKVFVSSTLAGICIAIGGVLFPFARRWLAGK